MAEWDSTLAPDPQACRPSFRCIAGYHPQCPRPFACGCPCHEPGSPYFGAVKRLPTEPEHRTVQQVVRQMSEAQWQDWYERNTMAGAMERLNREVRTLWDMTFGNRLSALLDAWPLAGYLAYGLVALIAIIAALLPLLR